MRPSPILAAPTLAALAVPLLLVCALPASAPAEARPRPARHHHRAAGASDMDRTLALMAERDRLRGRPDWAPPRPLASYLPPATRERLAAPPFTGWGYGGTVPGAWPGF